MNDRASRESDLLIRGFDFEMISPGCHPGADKWCARADLDKDISEVLPLVNGRYPEAQYDHKARVLLMKVEGRKYALRPRQISGSPVNDREEAYHVLSRIADLVNDTWHNRESIEPSYDQKTVPPVMELYRHLPRTNCGECGYPACMGFVAALRKGEADLACCPVLDREGYAVNREALLRLLGG
jgi:ArsR family metal-binding transcriptional regulator